MSRRLALATACLLTLLPASHHRFAPRPAARTACLPEGRGVPPRHWIGCAGDPGPRRDLSGVERLLSGLAIPLDTATEPDLAVVPGLSPRLAGEIVRDRAARGAFRSVGELIRVRGIGPTRLARAAPFLSVADQATRR